MIYITLAPHDIDDLSTAIAPAAAVISKALAETRPPTDRPKEYQSCFLSYSAKDKDFAARLHDGLKKVGVRCWLDARDMKIGERLFEQIDKAIQAHDKLLLVLSRSSVQSAWVRTEVENALKLEQERHKTVLFPICVDNAVLELPAAGDFEFVRDRHIGDFTDWQDKRSYQRAFSRLVRDLAISASVESASSS
jgi:hypothetical protein